MRPAPGLAMRSVVAALALATVVAVPVAAWSPLEPREVVTGFGPRAIALADLDGDGLADLASANVSDRSVSIVVDPLGAGLPVTWPVGAAPIDVAAGDVDGDGDADLAVGLADPPGLAVLLGSGTGDVAARLDHPLPGTVNAVAVTDLDGDGRGEILVGGADGRLRVLRATGGGLVEGASLRVGGVPVRIVALEARRSPRLAILDGATGVVTVIRTDHGRLRVVGQAPLGSAAGDLAEFRAGGHAWLAVTLPDLDQVALLRVRAAGRPAEVMRAEVPSVPFGIAAADLDADGIAEVLVTTRSSAAVHVLALDGGRLAIRTSIPTGYCPSAIAAGRIDADPVPDVAVAEPCANAVLVLPGS